MRQYNGLNLNKAIYALMEIGVNVNVNEQIISGLLRILTALNWAAKTTKEVIFYDLKTEFIIYLVDIIKVESYYNMSDGGVWYMYDENGFQYSFHDLGKYHDITGVRPEDSDHQWKGVRFQKMAFELVNDDMLYNDILSQQLRHAADDPEEVSLTDTNSPSQTSPIVQTLSVINRHK